MDRARILVAEDQILIAMELQDLLQDMGHEVVTIVASAPDAVAKTAELLPDLVLMDLRLRGETDGVEAARTIRDTQGIPVIAVTAVEDPATLARLASAGVVGRVTKPFDMHSLASALQAVLTGERPAP